MRVNILDLISQRTRLYRGLEHDKRFTKQLLCVAQLIKKSLAVGGKILIFGNGGSAAQAQHFAAELVCQFEKKRRALPAIALTTDSSILTAQSNDFGCDAIFSRQIEALCRKDDVVIGLTTSDAKPGDAHSKNIREAFLTAHRLKAKTVGLFSSKTKSLLSLTDVSIIAPSTNTALTQEAHQSMIHLLCSLIEGEF